MRVKEREKQHETQRKRRRRRRRHRKSKRTETGWSQIRQIGSTETGPRRERGEYRRCKIRTDRHKAKKDSKAIQNTKEGMHAVRETDKRKETERTTNCLCFQMVATESGSCAQEMGDTGGPRLIRTWKKRNHGEFKVFWKINCIFPIRKL